MSFSSRGQFAGPSSVPRDFGLLQSASTRLKPFHGLDDDVSEHSQEEEDEAFHDDARRAVHRYSQAGTVFDSRYTPAATSDVGRSIRRASRSRTRTPSRSRVRTSTRSMNRTPSRTRSVASSVAPSEPQSPSVSTRAVAVPAPDGVNNPSAAVGGASASSHARGRSVSPGKSGISIGRRARDMLLGGDPHPPPIEEVQQQYLQQQYPPGESIAVSSGMPSATVGGHRSSMASVRGRSSIIVPHGSESTSLRRISRTRNDFVPRPSDVEQVKQQLRRRSSATSVDIERSGGQVHERTPLMGAGVHSSYASSTPSVSGVGESGVSTKHPTAPVDGATTQELEPETEYASGPGAGKAEAWILAQYTVPILGTHLLELSLSICTVFAIGHLGTVPLAAASLASMTANVTGFIVLYGFCSALDSLLPQAIASPHPYTVGIWTQRMCVLVCLLIVPIAAVWLNAENLLLALRQDPEVSKLAAQYLTILSLSLPAFGAFEVMRRYLQALGLFHAPTIAVGIASAFNVVCQILLVFGPEPIRVGFFGSPIASVLSYYIMLLLGLLQCYVAPRHGWRGFTAKAFELKGLFVVFHLGAASTVAAAGEWFSWEIANLISSSLGTSTLAAQSILSVTCSLTYQLPLSISVAAAVRVGNLLGAKQPHLAAVSVRTGMWGALICGLFNSTVMIVFRNSWGKMFTSDPELVMYCAEILPYVGAFQVADAICGVGVGILRGSGRQASAAVIYLIAFYVFGLPLGGTLIRMPSWGLQGIWFGLSVGVMIGAAGFLVIIFRTDWSKESERILDRMAEDAVPEAELEAEEEAALEEEANPTTTI